MRFVGLFVLGLALLGCRTTTAQAQAAPAEPFRVAFWNLENFFDLEDDPTTEDDPYTPEGENQWSQERFNAKLDLAVRVLRAIGKDSVPPPVIGVCEVENVDVLQYLALRIYQAQDNGPFYMHVLEDSPYHRGVDVGLLYDPTRFTPIFHEVYPQTQPNGYKSRDILRVDGTLPNGDTLTVYVNHWPSRGNEPAARRHVADSLRRVLDRLPANRAVMLIGDFNDEPHSPSLTEGLRASQTPPAKLSNYDYYTATAPLAKAGKGSHCYRDEWHMLDNLLVNGELLETDCRTCLDLNSVRVYDETWMRQGPSAGKYAQYPNRTYVGTRYLGGVSDHFPVFADLNLKSN